MIDDYQAKRRRARVVQRSLLAVGLLLAVTSAVITYYFASRAPAGESPSSTETTPVLVAKRDISARTAISSDDVMVVQTTAAVVPAGSLREPNEAIGKVATQGIAANEIITGSRFSESPSTGYAIFPEGQRPAGTAPDFRAMSMHVPEAQAVGGTVRAGDHVDILFSLAFVPQQLGTAIPSELDYAARILAENVAVLAKDATTLYTFRVDAAQAERIAAMHAAGAQLHLLLRSGDDTRAPRASGTIYSSEAGRIIRAIPTSSPAPR